MFYLLQTFSLSITESSFHSFAFPSEKDNPSKSGEIYTHIKHSLQVKTVVMYKWNKCWWILVKQNREWFPGSIVKQVMQCYIFLDNLWLRKLSNLHFFWNYSFNNLAAAAQLQFPLRDK